MSEASAKMCPYCAEQIRAAAKVCPRCRQWLSLLSLRNPAVFVTVFIFGLVVSGVGLIIFMDRLTDPGIDFAMYRNGISVVESHMNFGTEGKEPAVYIVAVITNKTDIAWKQVQLDVSFFNRAGTLIDARSGYYAWTLYPHDDSALRINTTPSHPLTDYDSYKIVVNYARDAKARF
jgi:hypothetical protein